MTQFDHELGTFSRKLRPRARRVSSDATGRLMMAEAREAAALLRPSQTCCGPHDPVRVSGRSSGEARVNPWFRILAQAAIGVLGPIDTASDAPSPLAFADIDIATRLLAAAGWADASVDPLTARPETRGRANDAATN